MSAPAGGWRPPASDGLTFVGSPETLYRTTTERYADQARLGWEAYVRATVAGSERTGGRFNPRGEFGALYTSDDEATAWEEAAARYRRDGVSGLPESMHLVQITLESGRYADFLTDSVQEDFGVSREDLVSENPSEDQKAACLRAARAVRAFGDFLVSPSARGVGSNVPLYPDRTDSGLRMSFAAASAGRVPDHLRQRATEPW